MSVADKTVLAFPGRAPVPVPRIVKRLLQIALSLAVTGAVMFTMMLGSSFLQTKTTVEKVFAVWWAFVVRSDILATGVLTATVAVLVVYWMRDQERR